MKKVWIFLTAVIFLAAMSASFAYAQDQPAQDQQAQDQQAPDQQAQDQQGPNPQAQDQQGPNQIGRASWRGRV